eukprot:COSAG04_NODE_1417_length_6841_cov_15.033573_1_plen_79_part_10
MQALRKEYVDIVCTGPGTYCTFRLWCELEPHLLKRLVAAAATGSCTDAFIPDAQAALAALYFGGTRDIAQRSGTHFSKT